MEATLVYTDRWISRETEYHSVIKKKKILSFATTWIVLEGIMLNEKFRHGTTYTIYVV